jgi:hypothetical protein
MVGCLYFTSREFLPLVKLLYALYVHNIGIITIVKHKIPQATCGFMYYRKSSNYLAISCSTRLFKHEFFIQ